MNLKILSIAISLMLICFSANSTIINVDNNPNAPAGYYSSLPIAVNAASDGDTIYLYPSNTSYGNITIDKKLHFFGSGYDGTTGFVSKLDIVYLDTNTTNSTNSSGSTFMGLTITNYISVSKPNIANIIFSGNYISYHYNSLSLSSNCPGWLITNNLIRGYINANNNGSLIISNNIFMGGRDYPLSNINSKTVIISHNLFMGFEYFSNVYGAIITDNIFICTNTNIPSYNYKNVYYNNLSWRSTLTPYNIPPEGSSGSNNISNQDPQFETAPASGNFDMSKDYHLKSTSPAKNAASDGTDIGPYGGNKPFVWGGTYSIPKIDEVNITNPVINQSTPLNVNVKGKNADL